MQKHFLFLLALIFSAVLITSCGGSSGGGESDTPVGDDLNAGYELTEITCTGTATGGTFASGSFSVAVAQGTMTSCVGATSPSVSADTTVPSGLDISSTETNVTSGAAAYTLALGDRGFTTTTEGAVTITAPFDPTAPNAAGKNTNPYVFLRIIDLSDNSLFDITGTVDAVNNVVTANLEGLPSSMTVAVVYNPNMEATISTDTANTSVASPIKVTPSTWGAAKWCAVYDAADTAIVAALATYQQDTGDATKTVADMIKAQVTNPAVQSQNYYVAAGFRQPALPILKTASDDCGAALGTTPRFSINVRTKGSGYSPIDPNTVAGPDGYRFGKLYVGANRLNLTTSDTYGPTMASVAHEMFHAIQGGYEYADPWAKSILGYEEGSATTYGRTIGVNFGTVSTEPKARPASDEIFKLDHYITQNSASATVNIDTIAYSNQDFFAYVGRQYGGSDLSYLATLFSQMRSDSAAQASEPLKYQPPRSLFFGSMNITFQANFAGQPTLADVYLDFIRERAMNHNAASQLHGGEPTTAGTFNSSLFNSTALWSVSIDPLAVAEVTQIYGAVAPFAARAVRITPSQAVAAGGTGATITVTVAPATGSVGTAFAGYAWQNGTRTTLSSTNTFSNFGLSAADEIIIIVAKVDIVDTVEDVRITINGTSGSGGGGGGTASTFTLDTFTPSTEPSWTPAWIMVTPDFGGIGVIDAAISSTTDIIQMATLPNMQVQLSTTQITGAGTYTIIGDNPLPGGGPAAILYSPGTTAAAAGNRYVYTSSAGTITITAWGTAIGDHITGTFTTTAQTDASTLNPATNLPYSGTIAGTFDFVVGAANNL